MISAPPSRDQRIYSLQAMRAIAALMVVFGHAQSEAIILAKDAGHNVARIAWPGGAGVDLFFVISGFVMVYASEKLYGVPGASRRFLARRLIRIVPLYWICATVFLATLGLSAVFSHGRFPSTLGLITSYAFIPYDTFTENNGFAFPFFSLGWTLNYEMFFYLIFAAFIGLGRTKTVILTASVLMALVTIGATISLPTIQLKFWTQPITLEFAAGMGLALARRKHVVIPAWIGAPLIVAALAWLAFDPMRLAHGHGGSTPNDWIRIIGWGLPAIATIAATTLSGGSNPLTGFWVATARPLGDASYALYLTHPFVIIVFSWTFRRLAPVEAYGYYIFLASIIVTAVSLSLVVHRWLELPLTRFLNTRLDTRQRREPMAIEPQAPS